MKHWLITTDYLWFIPFLLVLSTVFVIDKSLLNGVVADKYFWFYATMGVVNVVTFVFVLIRKPHFKFSALDFLLLFFVVSILFSSLATNNASQNTTKLAMLALLTVLYFNFRLFISYGEIKVVKSLFFSIIITGLIEAIWGLRQLYGFLPSQHSLFSLTGSFFNPGPYAGYLAIIFPLALQYSIRNYELGMRNELSIRNSQLKIKNKEKTHQLLLIFKPLYLWITTRAVFFIACATCIAILLVLPAAMSRASWLAVIAGSLVVLAARYWKELKVMSYELKQLWINSGKAKRLFLTLSSSLLIVILFSALAGMYLMKKDSADGRSLMWKMALRASIENPLGVGLGNFSGAYGEAQAAYFAAGQGTETEELVAGSPDYGFNEYLQIAVEGGIISLGLFWALVFLSLRALMRDKKWGIAGSMVSLLVFACFSYPFSVLPILIVFVCLLAAANSELRIKNEELEIKCENIKHRLLIFNFQFIILLVTAFCLCRQYPVYGAYKKWNKDKFLYSAGLYKDVVKNYEELYPLLNDQLQFIFEYAQCLSKMEQYAESNEILKRAMQISCDPMLYNIMGKNHQALKEYKPAEECFIKAANIIPHRLYPFYLLALLYHEMGLQDKVNEMADIVQTKEPKVQSTAIREMRREMKKLITN